MSQAEEVVRFLSSFEHRNVTLRYGCLRNGADQQYEAWIVFPAYPDHAHKDGDPEDALACIKGTWHRLKDNPEVFNRNGLSLRQRVYLSSYYEEGPLETPEGKIQERQVKGEAGPQRDEALRLGRLMEEDDE